MRRKRTKVIAASAGAVVSVALAAYLAARLATRPLSGSAPGAAGVALRIVVVVTAVYVAMASHELGHTLAGVARGFRFVFWAVGPLWVSREGERLQARLNGNLSMWGGMAVTVPQDTGDIVRRFAWAVAGGPVTSLALALLAAFGSAAAPADADLLRLWLATIAVTSAVIFLVTVQPFGAGGGFASDGGRLWRLLRGGAPAAQEAALLTLASLAVAGVRPRAWPPNAVERVVAPQRHGPYAAAGSMLAAQHFLDRGEEARAGEAVDLLLALWPEQPDLLRASIAADLAFFLVDRRGDTVRARELLAEARGPLAEPHRVLRAQAAIRLAVGDRWGALTAVAAAREALARPLLEANDMDRELLDALAARACQDDDEVRQDRLLEGGSAIPEPPR